ncbi:MAG: M81 family metallopeptidase, partial [Betaproteobacteria bacterium]|nr:M81 family metallopeptidase [Betaproteobacteria bacterium]
MACIAVGGFQHETNTFAPNKAGYAAFETGAGWPGAKYGAAIFDAVEGANIPAAGAIQALRGMGHRLVGTAWAAASPSAQVTDEAFERVVGELTERLRAAGRVDGVYLDLHGAMVTESHDDGEGEILRRVREVVGPRVPIAASLDSHANLSPAMFELADALTAYRSYPHIDMADTGARAVRLLERMRRSGGRLALAQRRFDFLTGLPAQCTFIEPCRRIYRELGELENRHDAMLSFAPGFPMADVADCGMTVFGYGAEAREVEPGVERLHEMIAAAEPEFAQKMYAPADAVRRARERGAPGAPVILADTQDNPGAGGNGDTTGLLA